MAVPATGPLPAGLPRGALVDEVRRALRPLPSGAAVVVATSGGPDSTACGFLVAEARPDLELSLAHVRHGLREDDADDLAVVTEHASFLGVPVHTAEVVVSGRGGVEAAARAHRFAALRRLAADAGAGWILLGHTADDQAETVLLRLARGTGVAGLAAMSPVRGGLVRPLLRLRRDDVARFVLGEGLRVVRDPMNRDERYARVVARTTVLPAIARIGPDPVGALARLADLARADAAALDRLAGELAAASLVRYGPAVAVRDGELAVLEPALAARVLRAAVAAVRAVDDPPTAAQVADLAGLAVGAAVDLPEVTATRGGGWIALVPPDLPRMPVRPLTVPGDTPWGPVPLVVRVETEQAVEDDGQLRLTVAGGWTPPAHDVDPALLPPGGDPALGCVVVGDLPPSPVLRHRRAGDRVLVAAGTRKLQDVLVDHGVARAVRDLLPVVAAGDRVLWVPGVVLDRDLELAGRREPRAVLRVAHRPLPAAPVTA
jgi:tRNA(Ile)-lysidine synthase